MANEAVIIELPYGGLPVRYTIGNNAAITKGTLMRLYDPRTVSGAAMVATGYIPMPFAGIAAHDKVAGDGTTSISCYTTGVFDLKLATNSTCQAGDLLIISGQSTASTAANTVAKASDLIFTFDTLRNISGLILAQQSGMIVGKALEDGASAEVIAVAVGLY